MDESVHTNNEIKREVKPERPQNKNLKPMKKGETRNPNGRPTGSRTYAEIWKETVKTLAKKEGITVEEWEEKMLAIAPKFATKGDYRFYKDMIDRSHGTPVQKTDITSDGKPINSILVKFIDGKDD